MPMLKVADLRVAYDDFQALHGVSLEVEAGSIVAVIGANGAGKSTTLKAIAGLVRSQAGIVEFEGERVERHSPRTLVERGMSLVLEGRQLFGTMTVEENLLAGAEIGRARKRLRTNAASLLERFPRLAERRGQLAGTLSGGEQQMLAIARALMSEPRLLLLDEPSLGLSPLLATQVFALVQEINREGVTIVLVEQNVNQSLALAQRAYVLTEGVVTMSGLAADIARDADVRVAYLGGAPHAPP